MGNNIINTVNSGDRAKPSDINQFVTALVEDILSRNISGSPADSSGSLGSETNKWNNLYLSGSIFGNNIQGGFVPAGSMLPYTASSTVAPEGWLFADGSTIGANSSGADFTGDEYRYLFDLYKDISDYGNSGTEDFDNLDTVFIPNLDGYFVRSIGSSDPAGIRNIGSSQMSDNLSHIHAVNLEGSGSPLANPGDDGVMFADQNTISRSNFADALASGGSEARPINKAFPYIIKI